MDTRQKTPHRLTANHTPKTNQTVNSLLLIRFHYPTETKGRLKTILLVFRRPFVMNDTPPPLFSDSGRKFDYSRPSLEFHVKNSNNKPFSSKPCCPTNSPQESTKHGVNRT